MSDEPSARRRAEFALLLVDTVLLAIIEVFYLLLRFGGEILPSWGATPFPVVVLLALATMPVLINRSAELVGARPAGTILAVWLLTIVVLGFFGPGGDVVIIADWRILLLLLCGALPAAAVLGRALGARQRELTGNG